MEEELQNEPLIIDGYELGDWPDDEPSCEPECPESTEDDGIECEFENRDGSWWCTTHSCWA